MTHDEILNMPAGREMDALIAEKVTKTTTCPYWGSEVAETVPHYSTDISAAWEVVEKMSSKFIGLHKMKFAEGKWFALYLDKSNDDCEEIVEAETPMLAICLAALLSVEER